MRFTNKVKKYAYTYSLTLIFSEEDRNAISKELSKISEAFEGNAVGSVPETWKILDAITISQGSYRSEGFN